LFIGNGFFVCRLAYGHMDFIPFLTLPLLLWTLHGTLAARPAGSRAGRARLLLIALAMAAGIALIVDGSPVAIVPLLFWAASTRSRWSSPHAPQPVVVFAGGLRRGIPRCGVSLVDAAAQADFPRRTPESFTTRSLPGSCWCPCAVS
jgi:hypothetical protein